QTRLRGRGHGQIRGHPHAVRAKLSEILGQHLCMAATAPPLATAPSTAASRHAAQRVLPILCAQPMCVQARMGEIPRGEAVAPRYQTAKPAASRLLELLTESIMVSTPPTESAPCGILISRGYERVLGSPVREIRTPGFTWGEKHKGNRGFSLPTITSITPFCSPSCENASMIIVFYDSLPHSSRQDTVKSGPITPRIAGHRKLGSSVPACS